MTESTVEQQNTDDRLKDTFRRLMELYERHAQERQLIVKEQEEVNRLVQLLVNQTKEIGQYEEGIRKRIQSCINESATEAVKSIETTIIESARNKIDETHTAINVLIQSAQAEKLQSPPPFRFMSITIACSVLTGLFAAWILIPKPTLPLTSQQVVYLQQGKALNEIWPKLSRAERDKLKMLSENIRE